MASSAISIIVLILVASIAILLVAWTWTHNNNNGTGDNREKFADNEQDLTLYYSDETLALVSDTFMKTLNRPPRQSEWDYFSGEIESGQLTAEDLVILLRMTEIQPIGRINGDPMMITDIGNNTLYPLASNPTARPPPPAYKTTKEHGSYLKRQCLPDNVNLNNTNNHVFLNTTTSRSPGEALIDLIKRIFEGFFGYYPDNDIINNIVKTYNALKDRGGASSKQVADDIRTIINDMYSVDKNDGIELDEAQDEDEDGAIAVYRNDRDDLYEGLAEVQFTDDGKCVGTNSSRTTPGQTKESRLFTSRDMVLSKGFEWSVPHKHTPICVTDNACQVCPRRDQTALLGTLLTDARLTKVGSILPRFLYKEKP